RTSLASVRLVRRLTFAARLSREATHLISIGNTAHRDPVWQWKDDRTAQLSNSLPHLASSNWFFLGSLALKQPDSIAISFCGIGSYQQVIRTDRSAGPRAAHVIVNVNVNVNKADRYPGAKRMPEPASCQYYPEAYA